MCKYFATWMCYTFYFMQTNKVCTAFGGCFSNGMLSFCSQIQKQISSSHCVGYVYCPKCIHYGYHDVYSLRRTQYSCQYPILGVLSADDCFGYFVHDFREFEKCHYRRCYSRVGIHSFCITDERFDLTKLTHFFLILKNRITMIIVSFGVIAQGVFDAGGVEKAVTINRDHGRLDFFTFTGDITTRIDTLSAWLGQLFISLSVLGCQQNNVQRYMSMKSQKDVTR